MVEQSAAFHLTKHIKSYDNMTQIILPSKINCMDTSNEIQYHHKTCTLDSPINCIATSNEPQYHPLYFWGQFLSSLFDESSVADCETSEKESARGWKRDAKRRRAHYEMGVDTASFPFFHYAFLRFSFRVIHWLSLPLQATLRELGLNIDNQLPCI